MDRTYAFSTELDQQRRIGGERNAIKILRAWWNLMTVKTGAASVVVSRGNSGSAGNVFHQRRKT